MARSKLEAAWLSRILRRREDSLGWECAEPLEHCQPASLSTASKEPRTVFRRGGAGGGGAGGKRKRSRRQVEEGGRGRLSSHGLEGWPPLPGHTGEPGTVLAIGPVFRAAGVMSSGVDAAGSVPQ